MADVLTALDGAAGAQTGAGEVGVCSTGLIGERLPMDLLLAGVDAAAAALSPDGGMDAATSIMTTDTVPKVVTVRADGPVSIIAINRPEKGNAISAATAKPNHVRFIAASRPL